MNRILTILEDIIAVLCIAAMTWGALVAASVFEDALTVEVRQ